jgi:hypothetical protein
MNGLVFGERSNSGATRGISIAKSGGSGSKFNLLMA